MKLVEMTVSQFADVMASDAPAPGGGSASALNGAIGAGLAAMVCALTVGKKKYVEFEGLAKETEGKALALKDKFVAIIDTDTEAFNAVSAVFTMPKDTDEQKAARKAAMLEALKGCTISPYQMMELAAEALELVSSLVGKSNATAASDLGCAALNLKSAIQGAWLNVCININGMADQAFADEYRAKGQALLDKALPMADAAYQAILEQCNS
jgi:formiminotetrahydrofolate cyclodeaminase